MSRTAQLLWYILTIGVIGVGALMVGVLAARFVKKRLHAAPPGEAFTIQDLRDMHQRGEITTQEYETMRAETIARITTPPLSRQPEPDSGGHDATRQQPDAAPEDPPSNQDPEDQ